MLATKAAPNTAGPDRLPWAASAPATISVGTAGSGRPTCSSSTLAKTSATPYCVTRRTISVKSAPELALALYRSRLRVFSGELRGVALLPLLLALEARLARPGAPQDVL